VYVVDATRDEHLTPSAIMAGTARVLREVDALTGAEASTTAGTLRRSPYTGSLL
jgi:hypothetical protein